MADEEKTRATDFISAAMKFLADRPQSNVMLIVESPGGLEVLDTVSSYIWKFGLLAATEKLLDERYRGHIAQLAEASAEREKASMESMNEAITATKGKAN